MSLFSYCDFFQPDDYEYGFGQFVSCHDVMKPTIDKNFNIVWPKGYTANDALEWRRSKGLTCPLSATSRSMGRSEGR
jgi:hypothetical protein